MSEIVVSRKFSKSYKNRIRNNPKLKVRFGQRYALFRQGERGYPLNDHALTGKLAGRRAFSITSDIRVMYKEAGKTIVFLDIGTHNQVY